MLIRKIRQILNSFRAPSSKFEFQFSQFSIPLSGKINPKGEDAIYCNNQLLAVADGVGGWIESGVDPSKYSNALCQNIEMIIKKQWDTLKGKPKDILVQAAGKTTEVGSSK